MATREPVNFPTRGDNFVMITRRDLARELSVYDLLRMLPKSQPHSARKESERE